MIERTHFAHTFILNRKVVRFSLHERSKLQCLGQKLQDRTSSLFFQWRAPPSLCLPKYVIHVIKWTRPSPSIFAYCKRSKTGRLEVLWTVRRLENEANDWPHGCWLWLLTLYQYIPICYVIIKQSPYYTNRLNPYSTINYQMVIFLLWKCYNCCSFLFAGRRRRMERSVGCSWGTTGPIGIMDSLT